MSDLRRLAVWWRRRDVVVRDLPPALFLTVVSLVPALHGSGTRLGDVPSRSLDPQGLVVVALECLPLVGRRRWPAGCLALVAAGFAADQLSGYHTTAGTALPLAVVSAGAHLGWHRRIVAAAGAAAYLSLVLALDRPGPPDAAPGYVTFFLALAGAWGVGSWLRLSRRAEMDRRRHAAATARSSERTRLASELHDIVTHHVTAMVVQAEAARYLTAAPDRLEQSLVAVTDTGRQAMTDLRHLLDVLDPHRTGHNGADRNGSDLGGAEHDGIDRTGGDRAGGDRAGGDRAEPGVDRTAGAPIIGDLRTLVDQVRRAGQPVRFTEEGRIRSAAAPADLVAYRVVQEALTNALKYSHGGPTAVLVRHDESEITVEITTDGSGTGERSPGGSGRGLAGLRHRVSVLGGEFSADRHPDGGFVVRARIPAGSPS